MKAKNKFLVGFALGLAGLSLSGAAVADEVFKLNSSGSGTGFGNEWKRFSNSGDYYVLATAFSDTWDDPAIDRFQTGELKSFGGSGWGVVNRNAGDTSGNGGQHGIDNKTNGGGSAGSINDGDRDLILFEVFDKNDNPVALTLNSLRIGYGLDGDGATNALRNNSADLTVMAFNGVSAVPAKILDPNNIAGSTLPALLDGDSGWVRNDLDNVEEDTLTAVNLNESASSWIVGTAFDQDNDASKLNKLIFHVPPPGGGGPVPVPASLLLLVAGLPLVRRFKR